MSRTYHGVPLPLNYDHMDLQRRQAWKMGVLAAIQHLGADEARKLAAELEAVNGDSVRVTTAPEEMQQARRAVYATLREQAVQATNLDNRGLRADITIAMASRIVTALVAAGWGDLSGAIIEKAQLKMAQRAALADCEDLHQRYRDTIKECNEALQRATGGA